MGKTEARNLLDTYIDMCLDCDGIQDEMKSCQSCEVLSKIIPIVYEIRENKKKRGVEACEHYKYKNRKW